MLFGSSSVFLMLKSALNHMWGVTSPATGFFSLVRTRLKSFLVVLSVGLLLFFPWCSNPCWPPSINTVSRFLVVPGIGPGPQ